MKVQLFVLVCLLSITVIVPTFAEDVVVDVAAADYNVAAELPPATTPGGMMMTPEMKQRMMTHMQDMMIMMQNTAIDSPDGILVLQGNRLMQFDKKTFNMKRSLDLPLPTMPATKPGTMPMETPGMMAARGMVPTKLLAMSNGEIIIVRGQQLIRIDSKLMVVDTEAIPDLPPLTPAELSAVAPMAMQMQMMMSMPMPMQPMGTPGMPGGMPPREYAPPPPAEKY